MGSAFIERDAVRILFVLYFCGDECSQTSLFDDYKDPRSIDSESKLQKIDFWIRYPDHLAAALLNGCKPSGSLANRADEIKHVIRHIFHEREPVIRWIPMRSAPHRRLFRFLSEKGGVESKDP